MPDVFINRIATANPPHDVHDSFLRFGQHMLRADHRRLAMFNRMADRSAIAHRYSFVQPDPGGAVTDVEDFYRPGAFPDTAARMKKFEACAPRLAVETVEKLLQGEDRSRITHVIVTSCTGFSAPGIDLSRARIVWEARDQDPVFGKTFSFAPEHRGPQWLEAETQLPDGRRIFAVTNLTAK